MIPRKKRGDVIEKILSGYLIGILFLIGCSANDEQDSSNDPDSPDDSDSIQQGDVSLPENMEVMAENLDIPWSIEKQGDTFYITERPGELVTDLGRIRDVFIEGDYIYFISNNQDGRGNPQEKDDRLYRMPLADAN